MNDDYHVIKGAVIFLFGCSIGLFVGLSCVETSRGVAIKKEQYKAIEAGVGYYRLVDGGPESEFVYGVPEK